MPFTVATASTQSAICIHPSFYPRWRVIQYVWCWSLLQQTHTDTCTHIVTGCAAMVISGRRRARVLTSSGWVVLVKGLEGTCNGSDFFLQRTDSLWIHWGLLLVEDSYRCFSDQLLSPLLVLCGIFISFVRYVKRDVRREASHSGWWLNWLL